MASKKPYTKVNTRQRTKVDEHGIMSLGPVTMYLDARGTASFVFELPQYVKDGLGRKDDVSEATADRAEEVYKQILGKFSQHVKDAKAEPVLLVSYGYQGVDSEGHAIKNGGFTSHLDRSDVERRVSLSYTRAFRVNGHVHTRKVDYLDVDKDDPRATSGQYQTRSFPFCAHDKIEIAIERVGYRDHHYRGVVMDYTPELHAKLDMLIAAINGAAQVLHGLNEAKDGGAAALMALGSGTPLLAPPQQDDEL